MSAPPLDPSPPLPSRLVLERLEVRELRNISRVDLEPSARLNVISGQNGQGKTSLLEAIYFVATSRSFRTHRARELVRHGAAAASVRARFVELGASEASPSREQHVGLEKGRCTVELDGNRPATLSSYATRSPVVAFHPDELALSSGPAAGRRTLLDRIALFLDPTSSESRARHAHAARARQELLRRGEGSTSAELDAFETLCARHGAALTRARRRAVDVLVPALAQSFARIAAPDLELGCVYEPGGSEDEDAALGALRDARRRDTGRPSPSTGPHRDDLGLRLGGHPARVVASQGQHRALTLAMKTAEASVLSVITGLEPILLLDDVSSELDPERTEALFTYLGSTRAQIFLTTTRPELITTGELGGLERDERRDFHVSAGALEPRSAARSLGCSPA